MAFAHRGGAGEAPENSVTAFDRAVALGFSVLETDLRGTRDGVCLCFHDATLTRVVGTPGRIRDLPWAVVREQRLADGNPIPRLDDLLGSYPGIRVNVDVKETAAIGPLVDAVRRTRSHGRVCVTSFSGRRLAATRAALGPAVASSLAPEEVAGLAPRPPRPARTALRRALAAGAVAAQVPERLAGRRLVTPRFLAAAADLGLGVHVWTVDDRDAMDRLLDLGVAGLMTDRPTLLRDVLRGRGQWDHDRGP